MKKVIVILTLIIFLSGCTVQKIDVENNETVNSIKFSEEYKSTNITSTNLFEYISDIEVINLIETGTGILYIGYPDNEKSELIVSILDTNYIELGIDKVKYFNPLETKDYNSSEYIEILNKLNKYSNQENTNIEPNLYFVKDGMIICDLNSSNANNDVKETITMCYNTYNNTEETVVEEIPN